MQKKRPSGRERDAEMIAKIDALVGGHELQRTTEPAMSVDPEPELTIVFDGMMASLWTYSPPLDSELAQPETAFGRAFDAQEQRSVLRWADIDGNPCTMGRWVEQCENSEIRQIGLDRFGDVTVSTVWLALPYLGAAGPIGAAFETMVFGGALDHQQWHYESREMAAAGHERVVLAVRVAEGIA